MISLSSQGSEIFTVIAKDGDVGNPNPIRYSFDDGRHASVKDVTELNIALTGYCRCFRRRWRFSHQ